VAIREQGRGLHRLTAREVHAAPLGEYSDGGNLYLRVTESGAAWVYRYTAPSGRRRQMGLGPCLRANLAQCGQTLTATRDAAHRVRELLRQGIDPIDQRAHQRGEARLAEDQQRQARQREQWTLARCARDYHERVIEPNRTTKHSAQWISSLENHVPAALWAAPIDGITAPDLLLALTSVSPHERARHHRALDETVRRVRQRLEAVFEDAQFHGRCATNPAAAVKRKLVEAKPRKAQRGHLRALDWRDAPALLKRIRGVPGTAARALELAVLTASRTSEVLNAEWSEVDLDAALWLLPAARMKGREAHTVYLSTRAVEILRGQAGQSKRYAFPSPVNMRRPMSNMALTMVLRRLQAEADTTVHGLARATFSTWANEAGARPDVVEACLAHKEADRVRAAYDRSVYSAERRALLARWADYLAGNAPTARSGESAGTGAPTPTE
jgi:integrase